MSESIAHSSCGTTSPSPDLLDQVADKAYTHLGACGGRLAKAAALVRSGAATLLPDGTHVQVFSQSRPGVAYTVNGSCSCEDANHVKIPFTKLGR
jgi:hypothetical protein